jgi:hypothetical protein
MALHLPTDTFADFVFQVSINDPIIGDETSQQQGVYLRNILSEFD